MKIKFTKRQEQQKNTEYYIKLDAQQKQNIKKFVVCIPTYNRYDLLKNLVQSINKSDILPEEICIIDNGKKLKKEDDIVKDSKIPINLILPEYNYGVAKSWNEFSKIYRPKDIFISNDDVVIKKDTFEKFLSKKCPFIQSPGSYAYSFFLIREECWQKIGEFDEGFWPAYSEDNDYFERMSRSKKICWEQVDSVCHLQSKTGDIPKWCQRQGIRLKNKWHQEMYGIKPWLFEKTDDLEWEYKYRCNTTSDINEHLPILYKIACECEHITGFGTRAGDSSIALLAGQPKKFITYDIKKYFESDLLLHIKKNTEVRIITRDVLDPALEIEETDLLFIDTFHTYKQLKQELAKHALKAKKYLVFHDTEIFGEKGEDGSEGLNKAIDEFLYKNKEWSVKIKYKNNNGLTILEKKPKLSIIIASLRQDNLIYILEDIKKQKQKDNFDLKIIIMLDFSNKKEIHNNVLEYLEKEENKKFIEFYIYKQPPDKSVGGHNAKNIAIKKYIKNGFIYQLDDDNLLHPDFFTCIYNIIKENPTKKIIMFSCENYIEIKDGWEPEEGKIDTSMYVFDKSAVGEEDFIPERCGGDGVFIKNLYNKHKEKTIIERKNLCYYNKIRNMEQKKHEQIINAPSFIENKNIHNQTPLIFEDEHKICQFSLRGKICAEVGVQKGDFAKEVYKCNPKELYLIDCWSHQDENIYKNDGCNVDNKRQEENYIMVKNMFKQFSNVFIIKEYSDQAAKKIENSFFDFVYIDANHNFEYIYRDIELYYDKVKFGGWLCGHDRSWNHGNEKEGPPVKRALDLFCKKNNLKWFKMSRDSWGIQKTKIVNSHVFLLCKNESDYSKNFFSFFDNKLNITNIIDYDNNYTAYDKILTDKGFYGLCRAHYIKGISSWDKAFYSIEEKIEKRDFYYFIEDDVYSEDLQTFFDLFLTLEKYQQDLISTEIYSKEENPSWCHWDMQKESGLQSQMRSFNVFCRISRRLIESILQLRNIKNKFPYHEILFSSLAKEKEYSYLDYMKNENISKYFGKICFRCDISQEEKMSGKIYHPVKPLYNNDV